MIRVNPEGDIFFASAPGVGFVTRDNTVLPLSKAPDRWVDQPLTTPGDPHPLAHFNALCEVMDVSYLYGLTSLLDWPVLLSPSGAIVGTLEFSSGKPHWKLWDTLPSGQLYTQATVGVRNPLYVSAIHPDVEGHGNLALFGRRNFHGLGLRRTTAGPYAWAEVYRRLVRRTTLTAYPALLHLRGRPLEWRIVEPHPVTGIANLGRGLTLAAE